METIKTEEGNATACESSFQPREAGGVEPVYRRADLAQGGLATCPGLTGWQWLGLGSSLGLAPGL